MEKCSFIGHRDSFDIEYKVYTTIHWLIKSGVTEFYSGGMGNFDKMCEFAAKNLGGKLIYVPYNKNLITEKDILRYDDIICPLGDKEYSKFDIPNRNKWLVKNCDIFVCHVYKSGGAMKTLSYARKNNKHIINIYK